VRAVTRDFDPREFMDGSSGASGSSAAASSSGGGGGAVEMETVETVRGGASHEDVRVDAEAAAPPGGWPGRWWWQEDEGMIGHHHAADVQQPGNWVRS
jgi:hypothetical protein